MFGIPEGSEVRTWKRFDERFLSKVVQTFQTLLVVSTLNNDNKEHKRSTPSAVTKDIKATFLRSVPFDVSK